MLLARPANGCLDLGGPIIGLGGASGRSLAGDSAKISDKVIDEDVVSLETPLPNLKGGSRLSPEGLVETQPVEQPLARESAGRAGPGFLLLSVASVTVVYKLRNTEVSEYVLLRQAELGRFQRCVKGW